MPSPADYFVSGDGWFAWPPAPRKPAKKKTPAAKKRPRLTRSVSSLLIDRLEAAVGRGLIDLMADDAPAARLEITTSEYALLLAILFPEEYAPRRRVRAPAPTATAPGSDARVAEYAARVAAGKGLFAAGDARADGPGRGVRVVQRGNGSGVKVAGWEGE